MKQLILLLILVAIISVQAMTLPLALQVLRGIKGDCEGTVCPGGCCPYEGWQCCPDNETCAETMQDC